MNVGSIILVLALAVPGGAMAHESGAPITAADVGASADRTLAPSGALGPLLFRHGFSVRTSVPLAHPIRKLGAPGAARTAEGGTLTWQLRTGPGDQLVAIDDFKHMPGERPAAIDNIALPDTVPGETGCVGVARAFAKGRILGVWHCASYPGTILGVVPWRAVNPPVDVVARLSRRFDHIWTGTIEHNAQVFRISLVGYDPPTRRFDYVELTWPPPPS